MYAQKAFREERRDVLLAAMRKIGFAALVTAPGGGGGGGRDAGGSDFIAAQIPILVPEEDCDPLVFTAHVARANPVWQVAADGPALLIFQGPHAYIRPGWYETKRTTGKALPTWNYIAIHAHGRLAPIDDRDWLRGHVAELTRRHETGRSEPWTLDDAPPDFVEQMVGGIVGLRFTVERLAGVWKMIQHHPPGNRTGTIDGLSQSDDPGAQAVAEIMRELETQRDDQSD